MKERVKGREREGRKGERNEYDLRRGLLKNTLWDMYCYLHLKDGTTPRFADELSSVLQSGCVRLKTRCVWRESLCFSTYYYLCFSPPPKKVTPRNASLHLSFLPGKHVYLITFGLLVGREPLSPTHKWGCSQRLVTRPLVFRLLPGLKRRLS